MNQFQQAVAEVLHRMPLDQEQQPPPKSSGELPKEPSPQELAREEHRRDKQQLEKELTEAEAKAKAILGYTPVIPFDEGLRRTVDWYRASVAAGHS